MTQTSLAPATPTPCPQPLKRPALCLSRPHRVLIHAHRPVQFVWDCPAQIPKSHVVPWSRREESSSLLSARSLPSRLQLLEGSGSNPACSFPLAGTHTCVHRAGLGTNSSASDVTDSLLLLYLFPNITSCYCLRSSSFFPWDN